MDEGLKNKAYLEGSRLKNAGHDDEVIAARLEKIGIPEELIKQVVDNLSLQNRKDLNETVKPFYNLAIIKIAIGIFLAIVSVILFPDHIILPIGLVATGIITAVATKKRML